MKNKNYILLLVILLLFGYAIFATYHRAFVAQDYALFYDDDCDPEEKSCFIYICDPQWEECTGDPEEDTWYYKTYEISAVDISTCDPLGDRCEEFDCEAIESCVVRYCDPSDTNSECSGIST